MSIPGHHLPAIDQANTNYHGFVIFRLLWWSVRGLSSRVQWCRIGQRQAPPKYWDQNSRDSAPFTPALHPHTSRSLKPEKA